MNIGCEQATLYTERRAAASANTSCHACGEPILKAAFYVRVSILFDGSWETKRDALRLVLLVPDGVEGEQLLDFAASAVDAAKRREDAKLTERTTTIPCPPFGKLTITASGYDPENPQPDPTLEPGKSARSTRSAWTRVAGFAMGSGGVDPADIETIARALGLWDDACDLDALDCEVDP